MKKRRAVMAAVAVVCAGVIAVGLSGCEWFSFDGKRRTPKVVSDTLGYYGSDTAAWLTSQSKSPLELRREEYEAAIEAGWFTEEELSFAEYLKTTGEDSASLSPALRASVAIGVVDSKNNGSAGSGVIYSIAESEAYIITNYHVAGDGKEFSIYFYGDTYSYKAVNASKIKATYVGGSQSEDIAVLSVKIPEGKSELVQSICGDVGTRDSDTAKVGETVYAVGNPLGYGMSVVSGSISMEVESDSLVSHLSMRIDAPVTHGNSGGGLFDRDGKLVGIVYGGLEQQIGSSDKDKVSITGFGWAIPANRALSVAQSIIDNDKSKQENPELSDTTVITATYGLLGALEVKSRRGEFNPVTQTVDIIEEIAIKEVDSGSPFKDKEDQINNTKILKSIEAKNRERKLIDVEITQKHQVETILYNIRMGDTVTLHFTDGTSVTSEPYEVLGHFGKG